MLLGKVIVLTHSHTHTYWHMDTCTHTHNHIHTLRKSRDAKNRTLKYTRSWDQLKGDLWGRSVFGESARIAKPFYVGTRSACRIFCFYFGPFQMRACFRSWHGLCSPLYTHGCVRGLVVLIVFFLSFSSSLELHMKIVILSAVQRNGHSWFDVLKCVYTIIEVLKCLDLCIWCIGVKIISLIEPANDKTPARSEGS